MTGAARLYPIWRPPDLPKSFQSNAIKIMIRSVFIALACAIGLLAPSAIMMCDVIRQLSEELQENRQQFADLRDAIPGWKPPLQKSSMEERSKGQIPAKYLRDLVQHHLAQETVHHPDKQWEGRKSYPIGAGTYLSSSGNSSLSEDQVEVIY